MSAVTKQDPTGELDSFFSSEQGGSSAAAPGATANGSAVRQPRRTARPLKDGKERGRGKRGPSRTSCAECRRLKLKCDGQVPCNQCIRRGYISLCPDGTQQTGQGHRLFWNTTAELRSKLSDMTDRIRSLEDALRTAQPSHHLLAEDLLKIKDPHFESRAGSASNGSVTPAAGRLGLSVSNSTSSLGGDSTVDERKPRAVSLGNGVGDGASAASSPAPQSAVDEGAIVGAFGSLSISHSGGSKYFGHNANTWWMLHNEEAVDASEAPAAPGELGGNELPPEVVALTGTFPLSLVIPPHVPATRTPEEHLRLLYPYLPQSEEAKVLSDNAFQYGFFMFLPIPREQYEQNVFGFIYQPPVYESLGGDSPLAAHRLAILFMVLAVGSLLSRELPHRSPQADRFYQLGRAALFGSRVVDEPTIEGIQALYLMSIYMSLHDSATSNNSNLRWSLAGMMMKMSQTMGLHSDPERFGIGAEEVQRRRLLFAELYVYDIGQALIFSRPPAIGPMNFDVKPHVAPNHNPENNFHAWKFKFAVEILSVAHQQAYSAMPPSYATVSELTKIIETYPSWNPPSTNTTGSIRNHPQYADWMMGRHFSQVTKQEVLLYLHRPFFAKATAESRADPLRSAYGASVIAAYRSSYVIVGLVKKLYDEVGHPVDRVWFLFANVFGAAVVLGALVIRCPQLEWAGLSLGQLDVACELFSQVSDGFVAHRVYEKMLSTQRKAHASMTEYYNGRNGPSAGLAAHYLDDDDDDLLNKLGGKTRTIVPLAGSASSPSSSRSSPPRQDALVVPLPLRAGLNAENYHPAVVQYLQHISPASVVGVDLSGLPANTQQQQHHHQQQQQLPTHPQHQPHHLLHHPHNHHSASHSPVSAQSSQQHWAPPPVQQQQQQPMWNQGYNPYQLQTVQQGYTYEEYQHLREQYPREQWGALLTQLYPPAARHP